MAVQAPTPTTTPNRREIMRSDLVTRATSPKHHAEDHCDHNINYPAGYRNKLDNCLRLDEELHKERYIKLTDAIFSFKKEVGFPSLTVGGNGVRVYEDEQETHPFTMKAIREEYEVQEKRIGLL